MLKKIISSVVFATSLAFFTLGCDSTPPHRASQYLSQQDKEVIEEVISKYEQVSKIGEGTFSSKDDVLSDDIPVVTVLSEVYGLEKTIDYYFKLRKQGSDTFTGRDDVYEDHTSVLLISALKHGYETALDNYFRLKESRIISSKHAPALVGTAITYGLSETERAYKTIKKDVSHDHLAILTRASLEHGIKQTIEVYNSVRGKVSSEHVGIITKLALKHGLEKTLTTYNNIKDYGRDTFSSSDDVISDHQASMTSVSLEFGLEKALGMYDRIRMEGADTFTSKDNIPSKHWPLLAADGCIKDLEDKAEIQKMIEDNTDDMLTFMIIYFVIIIPMITR